MKNHTSRKIIFETDRLLVRQSSESDWELFDSLWNSGKVMRFVGFPVGLRMEAEKIRKQLADQTGDEYDRRLVAVIKETGEVIGECKLGRPDENGLSETDIKLLPEAWGNQYGVEIKRALTAYLFTHTDCQIVQATPNVKNLASIRMQEAAGGICVGEKLFEFPEQMQDFTKDVQAKIYHITRDSFISKV